MADPVTWAVIAMSAIGTGISTYSAIEQGNRAEEAARAQSNAERANAQAAQDAAALEARQVRRQNLLRLGSQRATASKSGVKIESYNDFIYDTAIQGELEALSTLYSGATQASFYQSRAGIARMEGAAAKSASNIKAGSTLIGGIGTGLQQYNSLPQF